MPNMIYALIALFAQKSPASTIPWLSQGLVELPCAFSQNLPYVTVSWSDGSETRSSKFLLDTGSDVSFLLDPEENDRPKAVRISGGMKRRVSFGGVRLVPLPQDFLGKDFKAVLRKNGAVGVLGSDFAATRDVLIDYRRGRLYATPPRQPSDPLPAFVTKLGFRCVEAIPFGDHWKATLVWNREPLNLSFSTIDTGASNTVISVPEGLISKPAKAESFTNVGSRGVFSGWIDRRKLLLPPLKDEIDTEVWFTTYEIDSVLAGSDLGDLVFFCFRRNEVWKSAESIRKKGKG